RWLFNQYVDVPEPLGFIGHLTEPDRIELDLHHEEVPSLAQDQAPEPTTLKAQDAELPLNLSLVAHRRGPVSLAPSGDRARAPVRIVPGRVVGRYEALVTEIGAVRRIHHQTHGGHGDSQLGRDD